MANIIPDSFKSSLLAGTHDFLYGVSTDTYKFALYTDISGYSTASTVYQTGGEVSSSGTNYVTGGNDLALDTLSGSVPGSNTAIVDFVNETFLNVTLNALGGAIYNSSQGNKLVLVLDFGGTKTATSGDFTIQFPNPTATDAIIRLG